MLNRTLNKKHLLITLGVLIVLILCYPIGYFMQTIGGRLPSEYLLMAWILGLATLTLLAVASTLLYLLTSMAIPWLFNYIFEK